MARTLPTAAAVAAVTGKGSSSSKNRSTVSRTRRRKYSGLTEQDDHRQLESNGTNATGKENEGDNSEEDVHFLSPPPNKNQKNCMSAPKKKKMLRTTTQQFRHDHSFYDPMIYFHTTPSSSTDATTVLMTLPPCTPLLEFNSKKEYLDLATTPRVLLDQFEKDTTAATTFL